MKTAILSVSDKTGLVPFAQALADRGYRLVASGGTAKMIREAGIQVLAVSELTGFPEILGGRVKTLHPVIYGGILSARTESHSSDLVANDIETIDIVVCNLYPFVETVSKPGVSVADAIEQIDIGGVTLLRAAAKNAAHVTVVCDSSDYDEVIDRLDDSAADWRWSLAKKAFEHTATYDMAICAYFEQKAHDTPRLPEVQLKHDVLVSTLRYGENPHQEAALYRGVAQEMPFEVLQGKAMSYNNLIDLEGAVQAIEQFERPVVSIIKHTNPCGLAVGDDVLEAFDKALASDPVSAFGSIIALNRKVTVELLERIGALFVEVLAAPSFDEDALEWLGRKKKNCRAVLMKPVGGAAQFQLKSCLGMTLIQSDDVHRDEESDWQVVSERAPTDSEWDDLKFAWTAVRYVKSNAIVLCKGEATVGVGAGQMNRLQSVKLAVEQAGEKGRGAALASDAFFPFADGLQAAVSAGITAVIQPGGSIRDDEVIQAANAAGLTMIFTGKRHFKH